MIAGSLSRRYTKALFQLAREVGEEEKIGREVEQFYAAYGQTELQQVLTNPAGIVGYYRRLLNELKGRIDAKVISAGALDPATVERLRARLRAISRKDVVLQQQTDPSLLGGLLVELEGKVYDGSVRTQLEKMKQRIARGY
jgi:F-type H+-transporting ATPase subunit delta